MTERDPWGHRLQLLAIVSSATRIRTLINYQQDPKLWITPSVRKGTALIHVPISVWFKSAHLSKFQMHWGYVRKPGCRERCTRGAHTFQLSSLPHFGFTVFSSPSARASCNSWLPLVSCKTWKHTPPFGRQQLLGIHGQPKRAEQDITMVAWIWSNCSREIKLLGNENPGVLKNRK